MSRQTVLVIFGGESSEHDVSVMSARNVFAAMDDTTYDVRLCYIDKRGKWWLLETWPIQLERHGGSQLVAVPGTGCFMTLPGNQPLHVDMILAVLHGENGHEDGAIQGLAQLVHVPVVGCGLGASAVCWDKYYTKRLLEHAGLAIVPYRVYSHGQLMPNYHDLAQQLHPTMFVKPTTAGSSFGVSKVTSEDELTSAIETALEYSSTVLIEQAVVGRELEVAILGTPPRHQASGIGEIIPGESFYSYADKYSDTSSAQVITAAEVTPELDTTLREMALRAYETLGCRGLARVDFLVDENDKPYINELNTLPGFTNISQYPKLWQEQGISYGQLINRLIEMTVK